MEFYFPLHMTVHEKSTSRANANLEAQRKTLNTNGRRSAVVGGADVPLIKLVYREKSKLFSR